MRHNFEKELPLIEELGVIAEETSDLFHNTEMPEAALFVALNLVERVRDRSISLKPLLAEYHKHNTLFGLGLLIRNMSSDTIMTIHLHHLLFKRDFKGLEKEATAILNEGKKFTKRYYSILMEHAETEDLKVRFQQEIDKLGSSGKSKSHLTVLNEILGIQPRNEEDIFKRILTHQAADTYLLFSKMEHFGIESQKLLSWETKGQVKTLIDRIYIVMPQQLALLHDIILLHRSNKSVAKRCEVSIKFRDKMGQLWDSFQKPK